MGDVLIYVRVIHFGATLLVAGIAFFIVFVAEPAFHNTHGEMVRVHATVRLQLARTALLALILALLSGAAWFLLKAEDMTEQPLLQLLSQDALWIVLWHTEFGMDWLTRLVLAGFLAAALVSLPRAPRSESVGAQAAAVALAAAFGGTLAWSGHAAGGLGLEAFLHPAADVLHLLAAAAWLGALVPLARMLKAVGNDDDSLAVARRAASRFSILGIASVATLLVTGTVNTWYLAGSVPALVGTIYGGLLLAKIGLFGGMVAIAAVNKLRFTPRLARAARMAARKDALRQLRRNAAAEVLVGAIIIGIVGVLGTEPPGLHQAASPAAHASHHSH